jgi:Tol biopolymer transport system component
MAGLAIRPPAVHALGAGTTVRATVSADGGDPDGDSSRAALSADGHVAVFASSARNLVAGPAGPGAGATHVFWRDLVHQVTRQVDLSAAGAQPDGPATLPAVSDDGRYVAFQSNATNLVAGGTRRSGDIYRRDLATGTTVLVSVSAAGGEANGFSTRPAISGDGRYVAFNSSATDLTPNAPAPGAGGGTQVYVRDLLTGTTVRVAPTAGGSADDVSLRPDISDDGRYVAFVSDASNLVPGTTDANGERDVYRFDRLTSAIQRVSVSAAGGDANGASTRPAISGDGRYLVFQSTASNLISGDTNHQEDVFRRDLLTGSTIRVSVGAAGAQLNGASTRGAINADGGSVAFASNDTQVVGGDHNHARDVFLRDLATQTTIRVSVAPDGTDGLPCGTPSPAQPSTAAPLARPGSAELSTRPSLSADGHTVLFVSSFCNLVPNDTSNVGEVFARSYPPGS